MPSSSPCPRNACLLEYPFRICSRHRYPRFHWLPHFVESCCPSCLPHLLRCLKTLELCQPGDFGKQGRPFVPCQSSLRRARCRRLVLGFGECIVVGTPRCRFLAQQQPV